MPVLLHCSTESATTERGGVLPLPPRSGNVTARDAFDVCNNPHVLLPRPAVDNASSAHHSQVRCRAAKLTTKFASRKQHRDRSWRLALGCELQAIDRLHATSACIAKLRRRWLWYTDHR